MIFTVNNPLSSVIHRCRARLHVQLSLNSIFNDKNLATHIRILLDQRIQTLQWIIEVIQSLLDFQ